MQEGSRADGKALPWVSLTPQVYHFSWSQKAACDKMEAVIPEKGKEQLLTKIQTEDRKYLARVQGFSQCRPALYCSVVEAALPF